MFVLINDLKSENYSLKEESGKFELTFKIKVLRKEKPLKLNLEEFQKTKDYIISELNDKKSSNEIKLSNIRKKQSDL